MINILERVKEVSAALVKNGVTKETDEYQRLAVVLSEDLRERAEVQNIALVGIAGNYLSRAEAMEASGNLREATASRAAAQGIVALLNRVFGLEEIVARAQAWDTVEREERGGRLDRLV